MSLDRLLDRWRADPETGPHFAAWVSLPPRPADLRPLPADVPPPLVEMLRALGLERLYSHQVEAWEAARAGENLVLATGTASGKTLAYNLPVLSALLEDESGRALYLFPTKALAQDQLSTLTRFHVQAFKRANVPTSIYDGDTPQHDRKSIRESARIILTNPDMLHTGILPHHTPWEQFFRHLRFVVIDEMHTYRGVFGSHVANVLRRLKRVARFYGAAPQFLLTSATIGNPRGLAERLIESPVRLIDRDGSGRGPRHFLLYNPPIVDEALGLRKSALMESVRLAQQVHAEGLQQVVFARSRRSVELLLTYLQSEKAKVKSEKEEEPSYFPRLTSHSIRGYRSGYLPSQRREIERGLRDGTVRTVVATNALELGIDIGGLEVALLVGYPGTVASARQQAGRAGRGSAPAAAVLVASASPIDQYLVRHPDYLFDRSPEQALINPDHLLILLAHLRCAMFELPFAQGEKFGALDVDEFLDFLVANREAHRSQEKYSWMADSYPAAEISLRSASPETVVLQTADSGRQTADGRPQTADGRAQTVGLVDGESALWMAHPGAVYLHEAQAYLVESLDLEQKAARLRPFDGDYFTEPLKQTTIQVLSIGGQEILLRPNSDEISHAKGWGELQVTTQVVGFRKLRWYSRETLGEEPLDLPPTDLQTTGYWLSLSEATVERLSRAGLWTNAPNDYGPDWPRLRDAVRARDGYRCQACGKPEGARQHDVHHKIPFRLFRDESGQILREKANDPANLVTLCAECHHQAETNVRVRSGLAGLAYLLGHLAPLFLMCDPADLGTHIEPTASAVFGQPSVVLYDLVPAGIGFSQRLYEMHADLMARALELVQACPCEDGCPACVGPGGENGAGGKMETLAILKHLIK